MKSLFIQSRSFLGILFLFLTVNSMAQNVAINATGAAPNASAMLDVSTNNKGILIPQVSLTSTTDASTITSPATSLLLFNTNAGITGSGAAGVGYYYNSGTSGSPVWVKLATTVAGTWSLTGNAGTTPGTNFIGTTDAQDLLIKTNNTQRLKVSSDGITTIGDGTNQTMIEGDGSILLEGTATAYTDLVVPLFNSRLGADNQPIWSKMLDNGSGSRGVYTFTFENQNSSSNEEEVFFRYSYRIIGKKVQPFILTYTGHHRDLIQEVWSGDSNIAG